MTREVAHFQMFSAALETIQPNFPPGILQGDRRYTHRYFNMSSGGEARGPWNEGQGPWEDGEEWDYIDEPHRQVVDSFGEASLKPDGVTKGDLFAEVIAVAPELEGATSIDLASAIESWGEMTMREIDEFTAFHRHAEEKAIVP